MKSALATAAAPRPAPPPGTDEDALLELWRENLEARYYSPRRIERDVYAVIEYRRAAGVPHGRWSAKQIEAHFRWVRERAASDPRVRRGRDPKRRNTRNGADCRRPRGRRKPRDVDPNERAVKRFHAFARDPDGAKLMTEILRAKWNELSLCGNPESADKERDAIEAFIDAVGPLWHADKHAMNEYGARRVKEGAARSTLRYETGAVKRIQDFIRDPDDGWQAKIFARYGVYMRKICTPGNTIVHHFSCPDGEVGRAPSDEELVRLFAVPIERMRRALRNGRKGFWPAWTAYALLHFAFATGARDEGMSRVDRVDLKPAYSEIKEFSAFEEVRLLEKAEPRGSPRSRQVLAIEIFAQSWRIVEQYQKIARPHLAREDSEDALFLGERGERLRPDTISTIFREIRDEAGLPEDLHMHCMRHKFGSLLGEIGVDPIIISKLMGHNSLITTAIYAKMTERHVREHLLACGRRQRSESYARA